jgi:hypothetical protein
MAAPNSVPPDREKSREVAAVAGVMDALIWRRVLEANPEVKRAGKRVVIHREFLTKLGRVLATGSLGLEPRDELWPLYGGILVQ